MINHGDNYGDWKGASGIDKALKAQRDWMEAHGGNLAGYRLRYAGFYDRAAIDAIYYADLGALNRLVHAQKGDA